MDEHPAGYTHLFWKHRIDPDLLRHQWFIRDDSRPKAERSEGGTLVTTLPSGYHPGELDFDHLVFALKYEGVNLSALSRIFEHLHPEELASCIEAMPTSKYGRRIFFLFELLTRGRLPIEDLRLGNYCEVLEPDQYFTAAEHKSRRHRVIDNLLGDGEFCPMVRKTPEIMAQIDKRLDYRAKVITASADPSVLARATRYLYTKETKSSFEIEREEPGDRMERYVEQLGTIGRLPLDTQDGLTELQNSLVDLRFAENGYRRPGSEEVYVGETVGLREKVHHIGAMSDAVPRLMAAWARQRAVVGDGGPVVEAACRSFSFVFIHPFGDGNGRIHRLLLHHVLARRNFLPGDLVVPISSVILKDMARYDAVLEDFSRAAMSKTQVDYSLDEDGRLTINRQSMDLYRYPDLTAQTLATFEWLERAIEVDLPQELDFLRAFDEIRSQIREVVEMPDRLERLFIRLTMNNQGRLSPKKRRLFDPVDDATIERLETIVRRVMSLDLAPADP